MKKNTIFIFVLLVLVILGGCGLINDGNPENPPQENQMEENNNQQPEEMDPTEETEPTEEVDKQEVETIIAPDFTLKNLRGEEVSLSDFRGKYVLLNFWATWCKWCDVEMPSLDKLNKEYDDVVVLAVDVLEDKKLVEEYIEEGGYEFEVLLDDEGEVAQTYYINSFPTSYFIDKEGLLIGGVPGMLEYEQMVEIMDAIRGE